MGEDSQTPKSLSGDSLPAPGLADAVADLFSERTLTHRSQEDGVPAKTTPITVVQSGSLGTGSNAQSSMIPTELGRFHHIEVVKPGGFGIVCRAQDSRSGRVVALKFPRAEKLRDPSDLKMFVDEANRAMELDHPGIVKTYSVEESAGLLAIVQQFVEGSDLRAAQSRLDNHQAIATLIAQVAEALSYAHSRGIYHRDLKPANILLDQKGNPYISDFGLAMHEREQLFLPKQRCGTPHYMPPEQVAGLTRRLDGRSDIWSLGVILYELLTKRRPFQGNNETEIYDQIEHHDPRPPRQIDPTIDRELQRIVLKCLERQQRDRYLTADDLAADLRHWVNHPTAEPSSLGRKFVPRGLRSFTAEDSEFFLELIPGSRDRTGLPISVKFWLNRVLLPTPPDLVTPIGVVFGPSGSGKSSFVRAGVLPLVTPEIVTVIVDCSATDTDSKLVRILSERLAEVPPGIGLVDLCAGISQGLWRPTAKSKVLIVLDQLEQRLCGGGELMNADLIKALRFCDGLALQALLLCRDDFITHLSRFTSRLGFDLREGENAQAVDLFNRTHARRVLLKYGQAFGQLPEEAEITSGQEDFLKVVFADLAVADYVVCVRLVMFAEMFRERPWTLTELQKVGGVAGIGEKFLESAFGSESRDKRLQSYGPAAQKILGALLPPLGSDIRGGSKSESELQTIAGLDGAPQVFSAVMQALDRELKLITKVEICGGSLASSDHDLPAIVYQLTHDSLIESIRGWLARQLGRTRMGRARLRLRELGAQVVPHRSPRYLPTHGEWLSWLWLLRNQVRSKAEQSVWDAARGRFFRDLGVGLTVLLVMGFAGGWWWSSVRSRDRVSQAERAVNNLLQDQFSMIPMVLAELDQQPDLALPRLKMVFDSQPGGSPARIRAALGLGPNDQEARAELIAAVLAPETLPEQLDVIARRLGPLGESDRDLWSSVYANPDEDLCQRFRAFVAEIGQGSDVTQWQEHCQVMAGALSAEPAFTVKQWLILLQPARAELLPHFKNLFVASHPGADSLPLAMGIVALSPGDVEAVEFFVSRASEWKTPQFRAAMSALEAFGRGKELEARAQKRLDSETEPWIRVSLSLMLANAGSVKPLVQLYSQPSTDPAAIFAVHASGPGRLNPNVLRKIYRERQLESFADDNLRRAVLMAFCLHAPALVDSTIETWLDEVAFHHVVNDPDAGCFSAAELLLRRLGHDPRLAGRPERRAKSDTAGILGRVLIDRTGLAFSIIAPTDKPAERLAVCTTELTYQEVLDFVAQRPELAAKYGALPLPIANGFPGIRSVGYFPFEHRRPGRDLSLVYEYCNWLSAANELTSEGWSYPESWNLTDISGVMVKEEHLGFRLLSSTEWQMANRSSEALLQWRSPDGPVISDYAWSFENARTPDRSVGGRLPNADGLFDMYGNVEEICHAPEGSLGSAAGFLTHGNTVRAQVTAFNSSPSGIGSAPLSSENIYTTYTGFRISRPLPSNR